MTFAEFVMSADGRILTFFASLIIPVLTCIIILIRSIIKKVNAKADTRTLDHWIEDLTKLRIKMDEKETKQLKNQVIKNQEQEREKARRALERLYEKAIGLKIENNQQDNNEVNKIDN